MRIAVVSDLHGNLTAFEAVLADLHTTSPDLVLHGGDLADSGSGGAEIVASIRSLGWPGVMGNTDELLVRPEALELFAASSQAPATIWTAVRQMAAATRSRLCQDDLAWLAALPSHIVQEDFALVHARPGDRWRAPAPGASSEELISVYGHLQRGVVIHGHTHLPSVRTVGSLIVIDTGSAGLPYDGDQRASYLLLDNGTVQIRRVAYDVQREINRLAASGMPHTEWTTRMLRNAAPALP